VVDDSIVRGNTQRAIVRMLRESGAIEVHVRISSPPVTWPCFYGIDFATRAELLANGLDNEGIRRSIGADTLGYVSLAGLIAATEQPKSRLCRACFDGVYPIELPADNVIGKHVLEGLARAAAGGPASVADHGRSGAGGSADLAASPAGGPAGRGPADPRAGVRGSGDTGGLDAVTRP
jgi:amidophosphoribosyltransferase